MQKRLDDAAQGAPDSKTLYKIIELLFTEEEAKLTSILPINFFTVEKASCLWRKTEEETLQVLNSLADKGILLDITKGSEQRFILAPTMAGFFEFSLMRIDEKLNCKALSELFHQYINQEEDFVKRIFGQKTTLDRVFVNKESSIEDRSTILDYEKASYAIKNASSISLGRCYCRHKMEHLGKACNNPQKTCLTLNEPAKSLIKHNISKEVSKEKALEILKECKDIGLVQIGDNVQNDIGWICNCCSCCCEALLSYKKLGYSSVLTSNFVSQNNPKECVSCGICVNKCPVNAIHVSNKTTPTYTEIDTEKCIGCGVCSRFCPQKSLSMKRKKHIKYIPEDTFRRTILVAIETGTIQNYLFDNYTLLSHKILRNFLGTLLSLPPSKQLLANKQLKSKFVNKLIQTKYYDAFDKFYKS